MAATNLRILYLDIDSTYRDRNNNPNQFDFSINLQQLNTTTSVLTAVDVVSDAMPLYTGLVTGTSVSSTEITLSSTDQQGIDNFYNDQYLEIDNVFAQIIAYNSTTFVATVAAPGFPSLPANGTPYTLRVQLPNYVGTVTTASTAPNSFYTTTDLSAQLFANALIRFVPVYSTVGDNTLATPLPILSYTPATGQVLVQGRFPIVPAVNDAFEVLPFTEDNFSPLQTIKGMGNNTNTSGGINGRVEIELLWLSIPNVFLSSNYSGSFENYPYLYLRLYNEGTNNAHQLMYSNNPNTDHAVYKIPVNEYSNDKSFLTLKDSKQKQTMQLRLDQNLHLTVTDNAGNVIQTQLLDTKSPARPNRMLQMSAVFAVRNP